MNKLYLRIPGNAKLEDLIWILNKMELSLEVSDDDGAKWLYEHQLWIRDKDE